MNDTSMNDASTTSAISLEHASFPHLLVIEWEALHRLAAASGDSVNKALLMTGTEEQQRLAAQEFMVRELANLRQRVSPPTQTKNKSDIVKLDVSTYSGEGEGRLHLNRFFCEVDIAVEARQISTELARTRFLSKLGGKAKE
ncbi:polyprotein [Phytophthora megakarya]|uniref:Polyprotein n=1 Tax=Phytophthora megakarya TaxID=4795 RepID=A0A225VNP9_9STRA|nr:polyprotein [Phytophthora megakarya]